MKGIRAWDYENKEFYIENNFSYLLAVIKSMKEIIINNDYAYVAENGNREISEMLAVKSVQGTLKEKDSYEILFRERLINKYYDVDNPKVIDGIRIYSVNEEKLEELIVLTKNQSMLDNGLNGIIQKS